MVEPLPEGAVTFLLTDVEGSTRLWDTAPTEISRALARHDEIMTEAVGAHGGQLLKTRGEGDSTFAVFDEPDAAITAAVAAQRALTAEVWPTTAIVRVRIAVHRGDAELREGDYFGVTVNRAARIRGIGHGGQILVSDEVVVTRPRLPAGTWLRDLGLHRLRDLSRPERIHQLGGSDLPAEFPPLRSLDNRPHNLPVQLTTFIGRDEELRDIGKQLDEHRLVTLFGPGGSGKTRLALQVAADKADAFGDGVWLVELAALGDGGLIPAVVAAVVGSREEAGRPLLDTLVDDLRRKRMLLIVDNCEHLIADVAAVAETVVRSCPDVVVLATSRQPLGVSGEALWPVSPLGVPPDLAEPLLALSDYESVRLFLDRAVLVRPAVSIVEEDARHITTICRRLDGIPLALELAAARVSVLSLAQLAARLDDALGLLTTGSRTAHSRQQTLRATIDWSYDLLDERERALLDDLSVFVGRFSLDAAEAVAGNILDTLSELVDRSLVVLDEDGYRLLDTVREYAAERLVASGRRATAAGALLQWLLTLPANDIDLDNARAALTWSLTEGADPDRGADLAVGLGSRWLREGGWQEGRAWAVLAADRDADSVLKRDCLHWAAEFAIQQGDIDGAQDLGSRIIESGEPDSPRTVVLLATIAHARVEYDKSRRLLEGLLAREGSATDQWAVNALITLGNVAQSQGDLTTARRVYEEALAHPAAADDSARSRVLSGLGPLLRHFGDLPGSRRAVEESLAIARQLGDRGRVAIGLGELADLASAEGDFTECRELFEAALAIARDLGDRIVVARSLYGLGEAARAAGDLDGARRYLDEGLIEIAEVGHPHGQAAMQLSCGWVAIEAGDLSSAHDLLVQAITALDNLGDRHGVMVALEALAGLALASGDPVRATSLQAASSGSRTKLGVKSSDQDEALRHRRIEACKEALGVDFDEAWQVGTDLGEVEALQLAIKP